MALTPIVTLEGYDGYEDNSPLADYYSGEYDGVDEQILSGIEDLLGRFISISPSLLGETTIEGLYDIQGMLLSDDDINHLGVCVENIELQGYDDFQGLGDGNLGWKKFKKLKGALKKISPAKIIKSTAIAKLAKGPIANAIKKGVSAVAKSGLMKFIPAPYNIIAQNVMQFANKIPGLKAKLSALKSQLGPALAKAGVPPALLNEFVNTAINAEVAKTQAKTAQSLKNVKGIQERKLKDLTNKLASEHKKELSASLAVQKGLIDITTQMNNIIYQAAIGKPMQALKISPAIQNSPTIKKILPTIKKTIETVQKRNIASNVLIKDTSADYNSVLNLLHGEAY